MKVSPAVLELVGERDLGPAPGTLLLGQETVGRTHLAPRRMGGERARRQAALRLLRRRRPLLQTFLSCGSG